MKDIHKFKEEAKEEYNKINTIKEKIEFIKKVLKEKGRTES